MEGRVREGQQGCSLGNTRAICLEPHIRRPLCICAGPQWSWRGWSKGSGATRHGRTCGDVDRPRCLTAAALRTGRGVARPLPVDEILSLSCCLFEPLPDPGPGTVPPRWGITKGSTLGEGVPPEEAGENDWLRSHGFSCRDLLAGKGIGEEDGNWRERERERERE